MLWDLITSSFTQCSPLLSKKSNLRMQHKFVHSTHWFQAQLKNRFTSSLQLKQAAFINISLSSKLKRGIWSLKSDLPQIFNFFFRLIWWSGGRLLLLVTELLQLTKGLARWHFSSWCWSKRRVYFHRLQVQMRHLQAKDLLHWPLPPVLLSVRCI